MDLVLTDYDNNIGFITLNNSEKGNVLNNEMLESIHQAIIKFSTDDNVRLILIRSNGKNFCLGLDLQRIYEDSAKIQEAIDLYVELLKSIINSRKPVISLIRGDVKAGGVGLACVCDVVIASDKSSFELGELFFGLIPANVLPFIISLRIPPAKARFIALTAKKLSASEAFNLNLVDEVFDEENFEKNVKQLLKRMLKISPFAASELKTFIVNLLNKNLDEASNLAKIKLFDLLRNPEIINAIQSFNAGETPSWFIKYKPENPIV